MTMMELYKQFTLLLMASTCSLSSAEKVLRQLHIVTRQGSSSTVFDGDFENPMQVLSEVGGEQLFRLGDWIRKQYSYDENSNVAAGLSGHPTMPQGFFEQYSPPRVHIESVAEDTALISALSLTHGLFPSAGIRVPIFTQALRNDVTIDARHQCPTFQESIDTETLKSNMDWNEMEISYMDLLKRLATIPAFDAFTTEGSVSDESEFRYVPLHQVKYVYDIIREAKLTCQKEEGRDSYDMETCLKLPFSKTAGILTDAEWEDLKTLAKYSEVQIKYGTERAGRLLAGNLLRQIANRMVDDEINKDPYDKSSKKVYGVSSDYPTLVAMMAILDVVQEDILIDEAYPGYGSALLFELLQDTDTKEHSIQILYKAAGKAKPARLRMGGLCYEKESCSMVRFEAMLEKTVLSQNDWCQACSNDTSDVCMWGSLLVARQQLKDEQAKEAYILENITIVDSPSGESVYNIAEQGSQSVSPQSVQQHPGCPKQLARESMRDDFIGFFFGGLFVGVALAYLALALAYLIRRYRRHRRNNNKNNAGTSPDSKIMPKTPKTIVSSPPVLASPLRHKASPILSPLRRKTRWENTPKSPRSPMANVSLDADSLLVDDEDEDRSVHLDDNFAEDMYLPEPASAPSKQNFPPEIV